MTTRPSIAFSFVVPNVTKPPQPFPPSFAQWAYDLGMDNKYISERVSSIRQEINELRSLNEKYWARSEHAIVEKAAYQNRELRLTQIKQELAIMLKGYA